MRALPIDIWSDIACPWCWVGKRHLEAAVAATGIAVDRRWRAFELDPEAPREAPESVDYAQRLAAKYRTSKQAAQEMIDRMVETGRAAGVEMRFDRIRPSRTFDAHRLLAWARDAGLQDALGERLFAAYLAEGCAVSDPETLAALAEEVGLDGSGAAELLRSSRHADTVRAEQRQAARMGITGVPTFVLADRLAVTGAQPPAVLREAIEQAIRTG
ncbi:MAG TPA: DsbA family oxidoreductase [Thermoanaerobaculia bacterium]|nr:DsbA family oxidoreductase [Thermoanaerobaculia bacterium]